MEIKIKIKDPILRSYLRGLFEQRADGGFLASTESCTGAVICAFTSVAERPVFSEQQTPDTVVFHIPKSHMNDNLRGKHLCMSEMAEQKVNVVLRREFEVNFVAYCNDAKIQGVKLKDAISLFIIENRMDVFDGDLETMKKRYYRYELTALKNLHEKLRQKAYFAAKRNHSKLKESLTY